MGGEVFFPAKHRSHGLDRTHYGFAEPPLLSSLSLKEFLRRKKKKKAVSLKSVFIQESEKSELTVE